MSNVNGHLLNTFITDANTLEVKNTNRAGGSSGGGGGSASSWYAAMARA
jgi:hypothetical protein